MQMVLQLNIKKFRGWNGSYLSQTKVDPSRPSILFLLLLLLLLQNTFSKFSTSWNIDLALLILFSKELNLQALQHKEKASREKVG